MMILIYLIKSLFFKLLYKSDHEIGIDIARHMIEIAVNLLDPLTRPLKNGFQEKNDLRILM